MGGPATELTYRREGPLTASPDTPEGTQRSFGMGAFTECFQYCSSNQLVVLIRRTVTVRYMVHRQRAFHFGGIDTVSKTDAFRYRSLL